MSRVASGVPAKTEGLLVGEMQDVRLSKKFAKASPGGASRPQTQVGRHDDPASSAATYDNQGARNGVRMTVTSLADSRKEVSGRYRLRKGKRFASKMSQSTSFLTPGERDRKEYGKIVSQSLNQIRLAPTAANTSSGRVTSFAHNGFLNDA